MLLDMSAPCAVPRSLRTKVCILGTGAGGGTLALDLLRKNVDLIAVDAGGFHESSSVKLENVGRPFGLRINRSIQIGGSTNAWGGVCAPLDEIDFAKRSWIEHSGWPIDINDLLPWYRKAALELDLLDFDMFNDPVPQIRAMLDAIDFNEDLVGPKLFQQTEPPVRLRERLATEFRHSPSVLLFNTIALNIKFNHDTSQVSSVTVGAATSESKNTLHINADVFVIALGALETPRILLNSYANAGKQPNINIGKYLMDHPMGNLMQFRFRRPIDAPIYHRFRVGGRHKLKAGFVFSGAAQENAALPNHTFYLMPSFFEGINDESEQVKRALLTAKSRRMNASDMAIIARNPNIVLQTIAYMMAKSPSYSLADCWVVSEQTPSSVSAVTLSCERDKFDLPIAKVDWRVSSSDVEGMLRASELMRKALEKQELVASRHRSELHWQDRFTSAAHHLGTARMANEPTSGVVDENLKVFGSENLFICDGSVFPTAGSANPALTIAALSFRLAKKILELTHGRVYY